jgi:hypothetical protein
VRDHAGRVVGRYGESGELELVEMDGIKEVPSILKKRNKRRVYLYEDIYTLIVSSQLNVARVMKRTRARVAHFVSGSGFFFWGEVH